MLLRSHVLLCYAIWKIANHAWMILTKHFENVWIGVELIFQWVPKATLSFSGLLRQSSGRKITNVSRLICKFPAMQKVVNLQIKYCVSET
jgi:hypothetical protein